MKINKKIESSVFCASLEAEVKEQPTVMDINSDVDKAKSTKNDFSKFIFLQNKVINSAIPGVNLKGYTNGTINIKF